MLAEVKTSCSLAQLFSDPGKKVNPFWERRFLVGQPPKKRGKQGATEQLSLRRPKQNSEPLVFVRGFGESAVSLPRCCKDKGEFGPGEQK